MGIIKQSGDVANVGAFEFVELSLTPDEAKKLNKSAYEPTKEENDTLAMIKKHFTLGYQTMYKPRREFNDMSVIGRMQIDQMSFNTYQPNNGEPAEGDLINGWRSNAIRPIVRNKCISIAAHATARLIFPKVFAVDESNDLQKDAGGVLETLMEWAGDQSEYSKTSLYATIAALVNPASFVYTEYGEVYRNVKREKGDDGKWTIEKILNEDFSGFKDEVVPVDEMFIENIYEHDIQKQGWLIRRRVLSYSTVLARYGTYENFKYVTPGVLTIYSDANAAFYEQYDSNLRQEEVEEVTYWNKTLDVKLCILNGVLVTPFDTPNPRYDKAYPFAKFGYELIDEGKFFYYKSLAFKLQQDANIVNTLYPMVIDGTYLSVFSPMVNFGDTTIGADVFVPGAVTTLPSESKIQQMVSGRTDTGWNALQKVEESLSESSQDPMQQGVADKGASTAYEISRLEQNAATVLGLFLKMIGSFVKDYGKLREGDILQYLTLPDVKTIAGDKMVYQSFVIPSLDKVAKKVEFDGELPDEPISQDEMLDRSYDVYKKQGGEKTDMELIKVNPRLFKSLKFMTIVSPDVLMPRSKDLEKALKLELFDRAIQMGPALDQEKIAKDFLLGAYDFVKDSEQYMTQQAPMGTPSTQVPGNIGAPTPGALPQQMPAGIIK